MKILRRLKKLKTKNLKLIKNRINRHKNNPKIKQNTIIERQHFLYCTVEDFKKKYPRYDIDSYYNESLYSVMTPYSYSEFISEELKLPKIALDVLNSVSIIDILGSKSSND